MMTIKKALAILTYARSNYFELVLASILQQQIQGHSVQEEYDIYVFQDGLWDEEFPENCTGHDRITAQLGSLPTSINVYRQDKNLGVALHFDFVERLLFLKKSYDFVFFVEDDLILAPGFMEIISLMAEKFHDDPRIGMISANPDVVTSSQKKQHQYKNQYTKMWHSWGFGLSKKFWLRRQPLVDHYLELIGNVPYRNRPCKLIFEWYKAIGIPVVASSQDYIKQIATVTLGACRVATYANFGLPIGRSGLHFEPQIFKKMGFDHTIVFDGHIDTLPDLDDVTYRNLLLESQFSDTFANFYVGSPNVKQWQARLHAGEFSPRRLLPEYFTEREHSQLQSQGKRWTSADIKDLPHMESEGIELLRSHLQHSKIYLEYGSGGSSILAADMGVATIHTIDSDQQFMAVIKEKIKQRGSSSNFIIHHVDIGPTEEWGQPSEPSSAAKWSHYCIAAWDELKAKNLSPDLILIDGRFRIASFLMSVVFAKPGTVILFDDYHDRPGYHIVEKHILPTRRAGRMAEFVVGDKTDASKILFDVLPHCTNPH
jgi:hypothetical protein